MHFLDLQHLDRWLNGWERAQDNSCKFSVATTSWTPSISGKVTWTYTDRDRLEHSNTTADNNKSIVGH